MYMSLAFLENIWVAYRAINQPEYVKILTMDVYVDTFFVLRFSCSFYTAFLFD